MSSKEFLELKEMIQSLKAQTKQVMNLSEAASYLGVTETILRGWNEHRKIPYSKPGGKLIFYKKADLDKFIDKNKVLSAEQISAHTEKHFAKRKTA